MRNNLWILLSFVGFLLAQGLAIPLENEKSLDEGEREEDENEGPEPKILSKGQTFILDVGETLRLPCQIENIGNSVVLWYKNKSVIFTETIPAFGIGLSHIELQKDHSLLITNLKANDSASYRCQVLLGEKFDQSVNYEVHVADKPKITRTVPAEEKKLIDKGTPLTLMCEAIGYPVPVISWTKKTRHGEEKLEGAKITIDSVNRKHSGGYECKATNSKGEDSRKIEIHVQYEPEVEVENDIVYSGEGYESELNCTIHAEPKAKITWLKDDHPLSISHHHITSSDKGNKHILRISGTNKNDFGVYRCVGENNKGTNSKTITLTGKPAQPKFHAAELSADGKSPILSWSVDSFSPILKYELIYRIQDKGEWKPVEVSVNGSTSPDSQRFIAKHTLNGLEPVVYQAQLRAHNIFGWSELSEPHSFNGNVIDSGIINSDGVSQGYLETAPKDKPGNSASELRISFALVVSLLIARYYC